MKKLVTFILLLVSFSGNAQQKAIPELPGISPEAAGFNKDSIKALTDTIAGFRQRDYRSLVVIKDNKIVTIRSGENKASRMVRPLPVHPLPC